MSSLSRLFASLIALTITAVITTFAYGHLTTLLEQFFSFTILSLLIKFTLAFGLLIIVFFGRPRSSALRTTISAIASVAMFSGAYGAFTNSLLLGDALILIAGTLLCLTEAIEGDLRARHSHHRTVAS